MNKKQINYLVVSDIHLGHRTNQTKDIIEHFNKYLLDNNKLFKKLDILFIAGDLFDRLLPNNSEEYLLAMDFLTSLALYCKTNNIKLRILEGTPSHDWKQVKAFNSILKKLDIELDFKYIETLHIEEMNDLGLSILYVPDEYRDKASDTLKEVKELMNDKHLNKIDIAIMHGQFRYQLPILLESSHIEEEYLNIIKYYIHIGHIHTSSVYERILAQGSFDRLAHNEEEDKGGMYVTIYINGEMEYRFIKNKSATIFTTITYDIQGNEINIEDIKSDLNKIKGTGNIRIRINPNSNLKQALEHLKEKYKNLNIKIEYIEKEEEIKHTLDIEKSNEGFAITKDNILELIENRIKSKNLDNILIEIMLKEAKEIHEEVS